MVSILLVEDNPGISSPLRIFLELDHHQVTLHENAASAVAFIESDAPIDVALVDYWLVNETAEPILAALRTKRQNVAVALITGGNNDFTVETTRWLGALDGIDGFLQKPFTRRELQSLLEKLCP